MGEIYSVIGIMVCVAMVISGIKSVMSPESRLYRLSVWLFASILCIMLLADTIVGIVPRKEPPITMTRAEAESIAAAMKNTENFLLKLTSVERVDFSNDNGGLKISVVLSSSMDEEKTEEFKEEIIREFFHNVIDEMDMQENNRLWGDVLSKVNVEIIIGKRV